MRIFVDFDEILPKFWILIAVGCQKLGSGGVRVSSPQFQVGFGCPKMSGYPSGFRVPYYITNRESSFIRMTNSPIIEILIIYLHTTITRIGILIIKWNDLLILGLQYPRS